MKEDAHLALGVVGQGQRHGARLALHWTELALGESPKFRFDVLDQRGHGCAVGELASRVATHHLEDQGQSRVRIAGNAAPFVPWEAFWLSVVEQRRRQAVEQVGAGGDGVSAEAHQPFRHARRADEIGRADRCLALSQNQHRLAQHILAGPLRPVAPHVPVPRGGGHAD